MTMTRLSGKQLHPQRAILPIRPVQTMPLLLPVPASIPVHPPLPPCTLRLVHLQASTLGVSHRNLRILTALPHLPPGLCGPAASPPFQPIPLLSHSVRVNCPKLNLSHEPSLPGWPATPHMLGLAVARRRVEVKNSSSPRKASKRRLSSTSLRASLRESRARYTTRRLEERLRELRV